VFSIFRRARPDSPFVHDRFKELYSRVAEFDAAQERSMVFTEIAEWRQANLSRRSASDVYTATSLGEHSAAIKLTSMAFAALCEAFEKVPKTGEAFRLASALVRVETTLFLREAAGLSSAAKVAHVDAAVLHRDGLRGAVDNLILDGERGIEPEAAIATSKKFIAEVERESKLLNEVADFVAKQTEHCLELAERVPR